MKLLGNSLSGIRNRTDFSTSSIALLLVKMIDCIEKVHNLGFIHRDIKPSNFVFALENSLQVYLVDFGLAKKWSNKKPVELKKEGKSGFRGTLSYASLNSHKKFTFN